MKNKIFLLALKMGWTHWVRPTEEPKQLPAFWLDAGKLRVDNGHGNRIWNPETSDADMVELLEKLIETQQVSISTYDGKFRVLNCSYGSHSVEAPTLRAAVVSFACKVWGIEE